GTGLAVDADEELQGGPFIQVTAAGIEPGEVGVPAHGCHSNSEPLQLACRQRRRRGRLGPGDRCCQPNGAHYPPQSHTLTTPLHTDLLYLSCTLHDGSTLAPPLCVTRHSRRQPDVLQMRKVAGD